jgi:hypothetical protein
MADSRTELILQAVAAALDGAGKPAGLTVCYQRRQAVEPGELPILLIDPVREDPKRATESRFCKVTDRWLQFRVRCRAEGDFSALDPLRQWAVAALLSNPSLGGLALEMEEQPTEWEDADASDTDYFQADLLFRVRYTTARNNLTKQA